MDGHALLAVRREDGAITYLDLQQIPPAIYDGLNSKVGAVIVNPTNVDWRFNRKLFDAVRNSARVGPERGWPDNKVTPLPVSIP